MLSAAIGDAVGPLRATPVFWLAVTLGAYRCGQALQRRCGGAAIANPVLIAIVLVGAVVTATGTPYRDYASSTRLLGFLLGPVTVALAVPLARNAALVRTNLRAIALSLLAGSLVSIVSGMAIVRLLGGSRTVMLSMASKAVTTPIAMDVSRQIGGDPALTAALAIAGGIVAAVIGRSTLCRLRVDDWRAQGLAAGVAGSGIAAAQVATRHEVAAAFAGLGIGLNGLLTAMVVPLLVRF